MIAKLSITEACRRARTVIVRGTMTIGHDNKNDIVLETITVSHWHAILFQDAAGFLLADLESTSGTVVNGRLVQPDEPVRLADGDLIQFGQVAARCSAPPLVGLPPRLDAALFYDGDEPLVLPE